MNDVPSHEKYLYIKELQVLSTCLLYVHCIFAFVE